MEEQQRRQQDDQAGKNHQQDYDQRSLDIWPFPHPAPAFWRVAMQKQAIELPLPGAARQGVAWNRPLLLGQRDPQREPVRHCLRLLQSVRCQCLQHLLHPGQ